MALKDYVASRRQPRKHKGIHAKSKVSNNKNSKQYQKKYRGQGK